MGGSPCADRAEPSPIDNPPLMPQPCPVHATWHGRGGQNSDFTSAPAGLQAVATGEAQRNPWEARSRWYPPRRGGGIRCSPILKRRRAFLVEEVLFVELNAVSSEGAHQFRLEVFRFVMFRRNPGFTSLGRGNDMQKKLRVRARQRTSFAPPGLSRTGTSFYGFRCASPAATDDGPSRAEASHSI
jgi:hypothetical protein